MSEDNLLVDDINFFMDRALSRDVRDPDGVCVMAVASVVELREPFSLSWYGDEVRDADMECLSLLDRDLLLCDFLIFEDSSI